MQHMEVISEEEVPVEPSKSFYLPHHAIMIELSTTTKFRVVFDGSALTTNGNLLNGNLMKGAKQQDDIFGIILRFQLHAVALSADIEKMYRQIALSREAKDFHRIVWRPDPNEELQHLRKTRVRYGIRSSSHHSIRSLRSVAIGDSLVDEVILSDSYVDDFLTGAESIDEAKKLRNELQEKHLGGSFLLRNWSSSSVEFLKDLPPHLLETKDVLELKKEDKSIKALGVMWYPSRDVFCFRYNGSIETGSTKRKWLWDSENLRSFEMDSSDHNYPQKVDASNLSKRLTMGRYITRRPIRNVASSWWAVELTTSDTISQIYSLRKQEKQNCIYSQTHQKRPMQLFSTPE